MYYIRGTLWRQDGNFISNPRGYDTAAAAAPRCRPTRVAGRISCLRWLQPAPGTDSQAATAPAWIWRPPVRPACLRSAQHAR